MDAFWLQALLHTFFLYAMAFMAAPARVGSVYNSKAWRINSSSVAHPFCIIVLIYFAIAPSFKYAVPRRGYPQRLSSVSFTILSFSVILPKYRWFDRLECRLWLYVCRLESNVKLDRFWISSSIMFNLRKRMCFLNNVSSVIGWICATPTMGKSCGRVTKTCEWSLVTSAAAHQLSSDTELSL